VDNTERAVPWITKATLTGNTCTYDVDTSTVKASSIIYINVATNSPSATTI
jgi:hypothetical protein